MPQSYSSKNFSNKQHMKSKSFLRWLDRNGVNHTKCLLKMLAACLTPAARPLTLLSPANIWLVRDELCSAGPNTTT